MIKFCRTDLRVYLRVTSRYTSKERTWTDIRLPSKWSRSISHEILMKRERKEKAESNEKKCWRERGHRKEKRDPKEALNDKGPIRTEVGARAPLS